MSTTEDTPQPLSFTGAAWRSVGELIVAAASVVAVCAILMAVARWREHNLALRPTVADSEGSIQLLPFRATLSGNLQLYPTDAEEQTEELSYTHGRKVLKERMERKIGGWDDAGAVAQWNFMTDRAGEYQVYLRIACDGNSTGCIVNVTVGEVTLSKTLESTGGWKEWASVSFGRVKLEANWPYTLEVSAKTIEHDRLMNLDHVRLTVRSTQ